MLPSNSACVNATRCVAVVVGMRRALRSSAQLAAPHNAVATTTTIALWHQRLHQPLRLTAISCACNASTTVLACRAHQTGVAAVVLTAARCALCANQKISSARRRSVVSARIGAQHSALQRRRVSHQRPTVKLTPEPAPELALTHQVLVRVRQRPRRQARSTATYYACANNTMLTAIHSMTVWMLLLIWAPTTTATVSQTASRRARLMAN